MRPQAVGKCVRKRQKGVLQPEILEHISFDALNLYSVTSVLKKILDKYRTATV